MKGKKNYTKTLTTGQSQAGHKKEVKKQLPEIKHKDQASVVIPQDIKDIIDYLHDEVGRDEWSGFLIYTVDEGHIGDPGNMTITVRGIYLLDIGTSVYTEFSAGAKIIDVYDEYPLLMDEPEKWKLGKIHSHHDMKAYHSGTDMEDLHDHAETHAYYTSLVVNFDEMYDCKIGIKCKEEDRKLVHKDGKGGEVTSIIAGEEWLMVVDCLVFMPDVNYEVPKHITDQLTIVKEEKAKQAAVQAQKYKKANQPYNKSHNYTHGRQSVIFEDLEQEEDPGYNGFTEEEIRGFLIAWLSDDIESNQLLVPLLRDAIKQSNDPDTQGDYIGNIYNRFDTSAYLFFSAIDGDQAGIQGYVGQLAQGCVDFLEEEKYGFLSDKLSPIVDILEALTLSTYSHG